MTAKLTVQNAEIKTAAVELKTLSVSGRQVTLAVFRQLLEEQLVAEDGSLNGVPWGTVNYHPDKCEWRPDVYYTDGLEDHWHVVWQKGPELRRSRVNKTPGFGILGSPVADDFLNAALLDHLDGKETPFRSSVYERLTDSPWTNAPLMGVTVSMGLSDKAILVLKAKKWGGEIFVPGPGKMPGANRDFGSLLEDLRDEVGAVSSVDLYERVKIVCSEEQGRQKRHVDQLSAIADLPQLFIAV